MTENNQEPRAYDAVLGNPSPDLSTSAVLGGIDGVIRYLKSESESIRIEAIQ